MTHVIASARIRNFRCHSDLEVAFSPTHALVGVNGSGKTAVLEALDLLFARGSIANRVVEADFNMADSGPIEVSASLDRYYLVVVPDGFNTQTILCDGLQMSISRRERAAPGRAFSDPWVVSRRCVPVQYSDKANLDRTLLPDGVEIDDLPSGVSAEGPGFKVTRKSGKGFRLRQDLLTPSRAGGGYPNVFYFSRQREKQSKVGFGTLLNRMGRELNWRYRKADVLETSTERWDEYYVTLVNAVQPGGKAKILKGLRATAEELTGHDFSHFEIGVLPIEQPFARAFLGLRYGSNQIELQQMGAGISLVVTLCLLEQVSTRSDTEVVFVIDEPELHLHPQLQRALADHLKKAPTQLICSTHSPAFLDLGRSGAITRLSRSFERHPTDETLQQVIGGKTIAGHLADIAKYYLHQTVYQEQDAKLFFADRVLLVEGAGDEFGLQLLARLESSALRGVTVVACRGKENIKHYALLCQAYGIPFFTLFDLDSEPITSKANQDVVMAIAGAPHETFEDSLEEQFGIPKGTRHKTSKLLRTIEQLTSADDMPPAVRRVVRQIIDWNDGLSGRRA